MTTTHSPVTHSDRVVNATIRWLADRGVNLAGAQTLTVRGRRSGQPHRIPVNPLTRDGRRYLVAPRGTTDWVRNVRVDPRAELRRGRKVEQIRLSELPDNDAKVAVLEHYLAKWGWEVGRLLPAGLTPDAGAEQLHDYLAVLPVFEVRPGAGASIR